MFWVFDVMTDFLNSFLLLTEERKPMPALYSWSFGLHKAPIAIKYCSVLFIDAEMVIGQYTSYTTLPPTTWGNLFVKYTYNVFFNWVDLMYEFILLEEANNNREWTTIGEQIGKIVSDILFKSTVDKTWNYRNSDVFNDEWGEPRDLYSGMVEEINFFLNYYDLEPIPDEYSTIEKLLGIDTSSSPSVKASLFQGSYDSKERTQAFKDLASCVKTNSDPELKEAAKFMVANYRKGEQIDGPLN